MRLRDRGELALSDGLDPAAPGAAVTAGLCGDWEHTEPCRRPHHSAIDAARAPARLRTLFMAAEEEAAQVLERIEAALRGASAWAVVSLGERPVAAHELGLAERLRSGPRASS